MQSYHSGGNEEKLNAAVCELAEVSLGGDKVSAPVMDVRNVNSFAKKIEETTLMFFENRIDILVNSAGVVAHNDFFGMTEEEYDNIMDTNAKGVYFMCQAVRSYMVKHKIKGYILNIISSSALRPAWTPYQMSKWSVRALTLGIADKLLSYGIIVNAIATGPTATPMFGKEEGDENIAHGECPSGWFALPGEIAALAIFMVSDLGNMIVGDTFYMTGGSGIISMHR